MHGTAVSSSGPPNHRELEVSVRCLQRPAPATGRARWLVRTGQPWSASSPTSREGFVLVSDETQTVLVDRNTGVELRRMGRLGSVLGWHGEQIASFEGAPSPASGSPGSGGALVFRSQSGEELARVAGPAPSPEDARLGPEDFISVRGRSIDWVVRLPDATGRTLQWWRATPVGTLSPLLGDRSVPVTDANQRAGYAEDGYGQPEFDPWHFSAARDGSVLAGARKSEGGTAVLAWDANGDSDAPRVFALAGQSGSCAFSDDARSFVCQQGANLAALDLATGVSHMLPGAATTQWREADWRFGSGGMLFTRSDSGFGAWDLASGNRRWIDETVPLISALGLSRDAGLLFVLNSTHVSAWASTDGRFLWSRELNGTGRRELFLYDDDARAAVRAESTTQEFDFQGQSTIEQTPRRAQVPSELLFLDSTRLAVRHGDAVNVWHVGAEPTSLAGALEHRVELHGAWIGPAASSGMSLIRQDGCRFTAETWSGFVPAAGPPASITRCERALWLAPGARRLVLDTDDGLQSWSFGGDGPVPLQFTHEWGAGRLSSDGNVFVYLGPDANEESLVITRCHAQTGRCESSALPVAARGIDPNPGATLSVAPDGSRALVVIDPATVLDVELATLSVRRVSASVIPPAQIAPTGEILAPDLDGNLLQLRDGRVVQSLPIGGRLRLIASSPDGTRVAVAVGSTVQLWNLADHQLLATLVDYSDGEWLTLLPTGQFTGSPHAAEEIFVLAPGHAHPQRRALGAGVDQDPAAVAQGLSGQPPSPVMWHDPPIVGTWSPRQVNGRPGWRADVRSDAGIVRVEVRSGALAGAPSVSCAGQDVAVWVAGQRPPTQIVATDARGYHTVLGVAR